MVQNEPITGILVDVNHFQPVKRTIKDCLAEYYRILDCDTIECTHRVIGGVEYDLICDEEGALKDDIVATAIDSDNRVQIYGNIFIVRGNNDTGEWESLTEDDIENILGKHAMMYADEAHDCFRPVIIMDGPYGMGVPAEEAD